MSKQIRDASYDDLESIYEILKHYIENTDLSYEVVTPSMQEFTVRYEFIVAGQLPFIVTE